MRNSWHYWTTSVSHAHMLLLYNLLNWYSLGQTLPVDGDFVISETAGRSLTDLSYIQQVKQLTWVCIPEFRVKAEYNQLPRTHKASGRTSVILEHVLQGIPKQIQVLVEKPVWKAKFAETNPLHIYSPYGISDLRPILMFTPSIFRLSSSEVTAIRVIQCWRTSKVSSISPSRGTTIRRSAMNQHLWFQPTHPHKVRSLAPILFHHLRYFKPRSHTKCDEAEERPNRAWHISTRSPTEGATVHFTYSSKIIDISTRTPTRGEN